MQLYKYNISCGGTNKQARRRWVDAALFAEELTEIYSTPTPNTMTKAEKIVLIDCSCPFKRTGVEYLYLEPKYESYSNTTHNNSWNKRKLPNLTITWTLISLVWRVQHIFLTSFKHSPSMPSADVIDKIADSDITSKSAYTDSYPIDSLMT